MSTPGIVVLLLLYVGGVIVTVGYARDVPPGRQRHRLLWLAPVWPIALAVVIVVGLVESFRTAWGPEDGER